MTTISAVLGSLAAVTFFSGVADACIEIGSLPATITQQGVHCLKKDLSFSGNAGAAISVQVPNVVIELNGFKIGGLVGGSHTYARGVYAADRRNITVRNGTIRGFAFAVWFEDSGSGNASSGHIVENIRIEGAKIEGIRVEGSHSIVRNNILFDIGNHASNTGAVGIRVRSGVGHSIVGNVVSRVMANDTAVGLIGDATSGPIIRQNDVRDISGGNEGRGIDISSGSQRALVKENVIINSSTGSIGIRQAGDNDACVDNIVSNYTTSVSGCSLESGNISY